MPNKGIILQNLLEKKVNTESLIFYFQDYVPGMFEYAIRNNLSEDLKTYFFHYDQIDYHYRLYLTGRHKTLHRVFWELTRAKDNKDVLLFVRDDPNFLFMIEYILLENEFYEMMPRHLIAQEKIKRLCSHLLKENHEQK